jgi:hypothetical protein
MSETTLEEPLLDTSQTIWVLLTLGWLVIAVLQFADGQALLGVGALLIAVLSVYRIARPG